MNKTINTKVGQINNSLKLKARSLKRQLISRFQLLIIYINFMKKTNNKGRGEEKYGHPTAIVAKRIAGMGVMMGVVMGVLAVGFLWGAQGAEAAE